MKFIKFLGLSLLASTLAAHAVTNPGSLPAVPAAPVADATDTNGLSPAATNTNPTAAMTALFGDPVVAKGDGFTVKRSDLDEVMTGAKANAAAHGQELPATAEPQMLEQLIDIQVLLQKANDADRVEGQQKADEQFTNILAKIGSEAALQRQLQAVGTTEDALRSKAANEATAMAALRRLLGVFVTDVEVRDYYSNNAAQFLQPEMVHVQHILLLTISTNSASSTPEPLSTNLVQLKRQKIDDLLKRARAGEDFTNLARQYSEDPTTKDNGGDLPPFPRGRMLPEFEAAAFSLNTNQISDVVTTLYGFHIIKLLEKMPAKTVPLSQVSDEIKDYLVHGKMSQGAQPLVEKLKTEEHVEIVDPNLKAISALMMQGTNAPASAPAN